MTEMVEVTKSISGKWFRMSYRGKIELTEEDPSEAQKKLFKDSVDTNIKFEETARRIGATARGGASVTPADR